MSRDRVGKFKVGDRIVILPKYNYSGQHGGSRHGTVVAVDEWNWIQFDGCECKRKTTGDGIECCHGLAQWVMELDIKSTKEYQDKAKSLKEWFDNE